MKRELAKQIRTNCLVICLFEGYGKQKSAAQIYNCSYDQKISPEF